MKFIEKITLIIYSNIMLILSIILCLLVLGWLDIGIVGEIVKNCITTDPGSKITLGVSVLFILLSIRCIFFDPTSKQEIKEKQGVLLENSNGKLMISKETIENLVESVANFTLSFILFCKSADKSFITASALTTKFAKMLTLFSLSNSTLVVMLSASLKSFATDSTRFSIVSFEIISFPLEFSNNTPCFSFISCFDVGSKNIHLIDKM